MPKIIKIIYDEEIRGLGTKEDPVRVVPQLWTKNGVLIAEKDGDKSYFSPSQNLKK